MSFIDIQPPTSYEIGFQSNVDFESKKFCYKYEYGDGGKRCVLAGDSKEEFLTWFKELKEEQKCMYELIRENDVIAEYYDIDMYVSTDEKKGDDWFTDNSNEIIDSLLSIRNDLSDTVVSKKDLIVLSAHMSNKLSLHIISKKTYFTNYRKHALFAKDVFSIINSMNLPYNIDTSVYSRNRCFRMFQNHKYGKDNTLVLFQPERYSFASLEESWVVITHSDLSNRVEVNDENYDDEALVIRNFHDINESLEGDLLDAMKLFLQDHPYLQYNENHRLNRIEHTTRPCLTDSSDCHSTENMFWYIKEYKLYIGCFCGKGEHLCIGVQSGVIEIELEQEPFSYTTHTSADFDDYTDFGEFRTVIDSRITGKGKTTCAMKFASQFERVLVVHHRLTLDTDYIQNYPDFISYQKTINAPKQTVCFNSLSKIDITKYDVIIIDEIRSILKQTEMNDMIYSTHVLFSILEDVSKPLVMLDANITDMDISFITRYRKDPHRIIIHDDVNTLDKTVYISPPDTPIEWELYKITNYVENYGKAIIIYNISIEKIESFLAGFKSKYRVLHVNRLTRKSVNMDSKKWYDEYDIIAYSPTISEGVSITDPRYESVSAFGIFSSASSPAESVSQMMARFRAIKTFHITVDTTNSKSMPEFQSPYDVLEYANYSLHNLQSIASMTNVNFRRSGKHLQVIEDEFCDLFCKNMFELSYDYNNYLAVLKQKLVNNGYKLFIDMSDSCRRNIQDLQDFIQLYTIQVENDKERIYNEIQASRDLNPEEFNRIKEVGVSNIREEYEMEKYAISHTINVASENLTVEHVSTFRDRGIRMIIKNIRQCFGFMKNDHGDYVRISPNVLIKEFARQAIHSISIQDSFIGQKRYVNQLSVQKFNWLNQRAKDLGFKYILSPESVDADEFRQNMNQVISFYRANYSEYVKTELIFGNKASRMRHEKINKGFITRKFSILGLIFGTNKETHETYQQISVPIKLTDSTKTEPSLLGAIPLPQEIVDEYSIMFLAGSSTNYCSICNVTLEHRIGLRHLSGKEHVAKLNS